MKICFLSSMHPPLDKRVVEKEAVSLAAEGHDVFHLCPGDKKDSYNYKGVHIITYSKPKGIRGRLFQFLKLYKKAKELKADCYHCNEVDSWLMGVLLKVYTKSRCVFDVHEHYPSTFAQSRFPKWLQPIIAQLIRTLFLMLTPFTDRLILAKQTVSSDFRCSDSKKLLIRNFTPLSNITFSNDRRHVVSKNAFTLVHLGLISKTRGWPQLIEAIKLMENKKKVRLLIIGEFNDGSRNEFENTLRAYKLEDQIMVYDWMPFEKMFARIARGDIGLVVFQPGILNHVYAMPHKMFDYMAAGLAIICPDFAVEIVPIIQETGAGLIVDTSNPELLAEKIDYLVSNPQVIEKMGEKGKRAVHERYNWETEVKPLLKMYAMWDKDKRPH